MPTSPISTNQLRQAIQIKEQIDKLESQLSQLLGGGATSSKGPSITGRRQTSPATIARMRIAQQARWAKKRGLSAAVKTPAKPTRKKGKKSGMTPEVKAKISASAKARWAAKKATTSPAKVAKPASKKGVLTPEGRAKLAASMKARWAAKKAAASNTATK